jgi:hypothetical protein
MPGSAKALAGDTSADRTGLLPKFPADRELFPADREFFSELGDLLARIHGIEAQTGSRTARSGATLF